MGSSRLGPLCSHHPHTLLSKRWKLADSPLKSNSRKKSGSRSQSRNPGRRLSAMSRGAGGPRAQGAAKISPAHASGLPGHCYPPLVTIATTWPARAVTMVTKEAEGRLLWMQGCPGPGPMECLSINSVGGGKEAHSRVQWGKFPQLENEYVTTDYRRNNQLKFLKMSVSCFTNKDAAQLSWKHCCLRLF